MKKLTGWIPISEAARRLGVSEQTVRRLLKANKIAGLETPLGRLVRETSVKKIEQAEKEGG